jgi:hypothetical protein
MGEQVDIHPVTVNASDFVFSLSDLALEHGINSNRGTKGPLIPFVITVINDQKSLYRYVADNVADGVEEAKKSISSLPGEVQGYAICYDAYIHIKDQKFDAIMVELGERGQSQAYLFAQRYKPKSFMSAFSTIGNTLFIENVPQRLK